MRTAAMENSLKMPRYGYTSDGDGPSDDDLPIRTEAAERRISNGLENAFSKRWDRSNLRCSHVIPDDSLSIKVGQFRDHSL